jgi:hypothetical protein
MIKQLKKLSKRKRLAIVQSIPLNMQARVIKELHILKSTQSSLYVSSGRPVTYYKAETVLFYRLHKKI